MSVLEFIAEMTKALAWPVTIGLAVWLLRDRIKAVAKLVVDKLSGSTEGSVSFKSPFGEGAATWAGPDLSPVTAQFDEAEEVLEEETRGPGEISQQERDRLRMLSMTNLILADIQSAVDYWLIMFRVRVRDVPAYRDPEFKSWITEAFDLLGGMSPVLVTLGANLVAVVDMVERERASADEGPVEYSSVANIHLFATVVLHNVDRAAATAYTDRVVAGQLPPSSATSRVPKNG